MQWDEARSVARTLGTPSPAPEVPLADALGVVLADSLAARSPLPSLGAADHVWSALQ